MLNDFDCRILIVLSESCWAIHTRDFRIHDPQNCQILVTVPEMLATMLLSPPLARSWTPRIKRYVYSNSFYYYFLFFLLLLFQIVTSTVSIVLDEIHSIGQQEGGAVWEQILLFAPCPIMYVDFSSLMTRTVNKSYS